MKCKCDYFNISSTFNTAGAAFPPTMLAGIEELRPSTSHRTAKGVAGNFFPIVRISLAFHLNIYRKRVMV